MKIMNVILATVVLCTSTLTYAQSDNIQDLYKTQELVAGLAKATGASEIGSLAGLVKALDQMTQGQREAYLANVEKNIATIQKALAEERPRLAAAIEKFKSNKIEYYAYETTASPFLYLLGGFAALASGMFILELNLPAAFKYFFFADVAVVVGAGLAQTFGFKEIKLKEAEVNRLGNEIDGLLILMSREAEILKLMKSRYSVQGS